MCDYTLFGLNIRSELPLPELDARDLADSTPRPDVEVFLRAVEPPDESVEFLEMRVSVQPEDTYLDVPDVGRFRVRAGREISMDPVAGCAPDRLRIFLLGSALGALLYQRRMLPLHANAIEVDGRIFAFAGRSGAGKSTLAAYFNDRGYRVLCDDVCAVSFTSDGLPLAWPGLPRLKLWADALEARGHSAQEFRKITDEHQKYHFPVGRVADSGPLPLARLYDLGAGGHAQTRIARLSGTEALNAVLSNIYRRRFAELSADPRRHLQQAGFLIKHAEIFSFERLWGFDEFSTEVQKLERHFHE